MPLITDYGFTYPNLRPDADGMAMSTPLKLDRALNIPGWMRVSEIVWLALQATGHKRIIELGSYCGRSTRALADNTSGRVLAIDRFPDDVATEFNRNTHDLIGVRLQLTRVDHADINVDMSMAIVGGKPDMVFIDGNHDYPSALRDIRLWQDHMEPGGLICGHDIDFPDVQQAVKECFDGKAAQAKGTAIWYANV